MKIGVLSDVHANAPALEAVLAELSDVQLIVHAGDVVGYNPFPDRTIKLFEEFSVESIRGNHDIALSEEDEKWRFLDESSRVASASLRWTAEFAGPETVSYLRDLPTEMTVLGGDVRVVHGSPSDPNMYVYPRDMTEDMLGDERVLVLGHTHIQAERSFESGKIVNPGSVGQPRDGLQARYAVVDSETWDISLESVSYDIESVKEEIAHTNLPSRVAELLFEAKW